MSFHDYVHRGRAGVSWHFTPSPSSFSDALPSLSSSSPAGSATPQSIRTPQSVSGELPIVKLPSYNELIADLGDVDMGRNGDRFNSFEPSVNSVASVASADPRATPAHCTPSYSYCPPQRQLPSLNSILSDVPHPSVATHHSHHTCTCQPHYHRPAPVNQPVSDRGPDSFRLRAVSPAQTSGYYQQFTGANIDARYRRKPSTSAGSSNRLYEHPPESEFSLVARKPKPARCVRREQPTGESRQVQATPRTTLKPARSRSTKSSTSTSPKAKRLPAHTMPFFATLFPKGVRNYTGVPADNDDDRENYFSDTELMQMMPSGYQRWQDAINRYKAPTHTGKDLKDLLRSLAEDDCDDGDLGSDVVDAMASTSERDNEDDESWKRFSQKAEGQFGNNGEQLYHCKLRKKGGGQRCAYPQSKQAVKRHINDVHLGLRPWPCPFKDCHKCFKQRMNLTIHTYACHTGQTPFHCSHCGAEFSDPAVRHEHCQKRHPGTVNPRKKKAYSIPYIEDNTSEAMEVDNDD